MFQVWLKNWQLYNYSSANTYYYIVDFMHIIIHKFLDVHLPFRLSSTK